MNLEFFIAKRIHFNRQGRKSVSRPAVRVAILGVALGLAVMIVAVSVLVGFKREIRDKVIAFGSHIQISTFENNSTFELKPIYVSDTLLQDLRQMPGIRSVQQFATKPGIIKTNEDDVQGIVLKGIGTDFDWDFYRKNLVKGDTINIADELPAREAIISLYLSKLLKLDIDSTFFTYFVQDEFIRARKFTVVGIYCTNFVEYDKQFILTDIRQVQQLNDWESNQASGLEVLIDDYNNLSVMGDEVFFRIANRLQPDGSTLRSRTVAEMNPDIFGWLNVLDMNVWIILILMTLVAGFNMISGLLILILERTNMIGILKAMGAGNWSVQKIFLYHSLMLVGKGMFWGNLIGLGLVLLQQYTQLIPLDPAKYYVEYVPVSLNIVYILLLNAGTFVCSALILLLPSFIISKILPAQSIKFE